MTFLSGHCGNTWSNSDTLGHLTVSTSNGNLQDVYASPRVTLACAAAAGDRSAPSAIDVTSPLSSPTLSAYPPFKALTASLSPSANTNSTVASSSHGAGSCVPSYPTPGYSLHHYSPPLTPLGATCFNYSHVTSNGTALPQMPYLNSCHTSEANYCPNIQAGNWGTSYADETSPDMIYPYSEVARSYGDYSVNHGDVVNGNS